ncbi:MAG: hypothetical protein BGP06_20900 [Rhizobiales bacterium 65-9]|mgnify:CR=1 FL=1|nr:hypothetical protein [Hyphomicrobiales bacterium]OJY36484.1 MAG: hypothetical protein BGP06_20900 [Rhizobiales bacterium 65-9]
MSFNRSPTDPAHGAADFLRRFGMALIGVALPCAAFYSRRAAILLMPLGAILIFMGTVIDPAEPIGARLRQFVRSSGFWITAGLMVWAGATVAWSPFPMPSAERFYNTLGVAAVAAAGAAAIPARMRAPALYFLPIGAFAAVIAACLVALQARGVIDVAILSTEPVLAERGGAALALFTPVALGWLLSRGRAPEAAALAIGFICATFVLGDAPSLLVAVITLAAFVAARIAPRSGPLLLGAVAAALVLAAPVLPVLLDPIARGAGLPDLAELFRGLAASAQQEGTRLLTGHGIETTARAVTAGILPRIDPPPLIVALWYDLGLMGAIAIAALIVSRTRRALDLSPDVAAAEMALICCAVAQMFVGVAALQAWWMSSMAAAAIAVQAIAHGQFRTRRPRARLFGQRAGEV